MSLTNRPAPTPVELAYRHYFGLSPRLATLLASMSTRSPLTASRPQICALRRAMEAESIDTQHGAYHLTEVGESECARAREEFAAWVRMAS